MRRRAFLLAGLAGALTPLPLAAQQLPTRPHVGILNYADDDDLRVRQFQAALAAVGYVEGKSLALTLRSANGAFDRLPALADELVAAKVDAIIALGPATWAARQATTTIPIVVAFSGDMVEMGVVASLAKPGGNITGFSYMSGDLAAKRLELLTSAFGKSRRAGVLYNPREPATKGELAATEAAAKRLEVALVPLAAQTPEELDAAFRTAKAQNVDGLMVLTHGFAVLNRARIIEPAQSHRLPMLYGWRDFVLEGGHVLWARHRGAGQDAAGHDDRILEGASPAGLPVEQPTRLLLTVNLKTAKDLGFTLPPAILPARRRGDRVRWRLLYGCSCTRSRQKVAPFRLRSHARRQKHSESGRRGQWRKLTHTGPRSVESVATQQSSHRSVRKLIFCSVGLNEVVE